MSFLENLPSITSLAGTDLIYARINPGSSPGSGKVKISDLGASLSSYITIPAFGVDVTKFATGGDGSSGNPWTGWDTAITWAADTEYRFRTGWYSLATSPAFGQPGISLIGEAGTYIKHTGRGNAIAIDFGAGAGSNWQLVGKVENLTVVGNYFSGVGTITVANGSSTVVGVGTSFTTQLQVGDTISVGSGTTNCETRIVAAITDDTHLTTDNNWIANSGGQQYVIGTTSNGFFFRGCINGTFTNLAVRDVAIGVRSEACVINRMLNLHIAFDLLLSLRAVRVRTQSLFYLTGRAGTDESTYWQVTNFNADATQVAGLRVHDSFGNVFQASTSESNKGKGVWVEAGGLNDNNTFINFDCESNGDKDFDLNGAKPTIIACNGGSAVPNSATFNFVDGKIIGSNFTNPSWVAGSQASFEFCKFSGTVPDPSVASLHFFKCFTNNTGLYDLTGKREQASPASVQLPSGGFGSGTFAVDANRFAFFDVLGPQGNFTLANPASTYTPGKGQTITFRIRQWSSPGNAVASWGNKYRGPGGAIPANTLVASKTDYYTFTYNEMDDKWDLVSYQLNI